MGASRISHFLRKFQNFRRKVAGRARKRLAFQNRVFHYLAVQAAVFFRQRAISQKSLDQQNSLISPISSHNRPMSDFAEIASFGRKSFAKTWASVHYKCTVFSTNRAEKA